MKQKTQQKALLLLMAFLFITLSISAQQKYPQHYFRSPVGFPIYLSGTFGELRDNHLHSGIDIKTGGVRGKKVYAVANGYVSRIKVSLFGYGKALYITHPDGYISVYGHLEKFNPQIERYVRAIEYKRESFTVQIFPPKDSIKVKKGEVIAYSGDTGGSTGPHLHFEIRQGKTQHPVNPLLFGSIKIEDNLPPKIVQLAVFPVFSKSMINNRPDTLILPVAGHGKKCYLRNMPVIDVQGPVSFGLRTYDVMNKTNNKNGIYALRLYEDNKLVFAIKANTLSFNTTRYVNSLIDYNYFEKTGRRLIRTQLDTNNRLGIYQKVAHHGIFAFHDTLPHHFKYVASDIYGNTAILNFTVKDEPGAVKPVKEPVKKSGTLIRFNRPATIHSKGISLFFPKDCFYRSFYFHLKKFPATKTSLSPVYAVHNRFVPVQKYFTIAIQEDTVPARLKNKAYIAYAPDNSSVYGYVGGKWKNDALITKANDLGNFTILADTIAPIIKPVNFKNGSRIDGLHVLRVMISDDQSGIKSYRPTLNGHWILMEYDPKRNTLTYYFDNYLKKGKNDFQLIVKDNVGNESIYKAVIYK